MAIIGVDVMSGDNTPSMLIDGCINAVKQYNCSLALIGDKGILKRELESKKFDSSSITIIPSTDIIGMDESPATACKAKPGSSVMVGARALKEGKIDAFISPGNTGATLTAALLSIGRLKGVKRPAIAVPMPTTGKTPALVLDMGANADCQARYLRQFAIMGYCYQKLVNRIEKPRIGLLNVGEEAKKGNELTKAAYKELSTLPLNFIGNVEPNHIFNHYTDVVVCDGFNGNILLKSAESAAKFMSQNIRKGIRSSFSASFGYLFMGHVFRKVRNKVNPHQYGGAILLGIPKPVYVAHGSSTDESIRHAIRVANIGVQTDITHEIQEEIRLHG